MIIWQKYFKNWVVPHHTKVIISLFLKSAAIA